MRLTRILAAVARVWRRDVARLSPAAPCSWHYLRPKLPPEQALHRSLWWRSRHRLPALLWLPLEILRAVHWRVWGSRRAVAAAVSAFGRQAEAQGVPLAVQHARIGHWARRWAITPADAYRHGLYRSGQDGLARLYPSQNQAFHRLMNAKHGAVKADYRLIQDKLWLAERLADAGVPAVASLCCSRGDPADLASALAGAGPVFCKSRFGSRGEGAFMAESCPDGLTGRTLAGRRLDGQAAVAAAWKALAGKGPMLIQPYLHNHPALRALAPESEAISLRVITRARADGPQVWAGLLYVQAPGDLPDREYWLLSVDAVSGRLLDAFGHWADTPQADGLLAGQTLPYWPEIARHACRAHAELPGFWAIAWDWIITAEGPVLLEGNAGWDLSPLQELGTDLVQLALAEGV